MQKFRGASDELVAELASTGHVEAIGELTCRWHNVNRDALRAIRRLLTLANVVSTDNWEAIDQTKDRIAKFAEMADYEQATLLNPMNGKAYADFIGNCPIQKQ